MIWRLHDKVVSPDPPAHPCMGSSSGLLSGHCTIVSGRTTSQWVQTSGRLSSWRIEMVWVQRRWANVGPDANDTYQLGKIVHDIVMSSHKSVFWIRPPHQSISTARPNFLPKSQIDATCRFRLAGPKLGVTHVWASSQSSCFPAAQNGIVPKTHGGKMASIPKTYRGKISQIQLSMVPGRHSASLNGYPENTTCQ
jgi:hypothetical protein